MQSIFTSFSVQATDVIEGTSVDEGGKEKTKVIMFVEARGETSVGEYRNEYVWKMGFEEGGKRVDEWIEFVDVGMVRDFYPKLVGEMKKRAEEQGKGADAGR